MTVLLSLGLILGYFCATQEQGSIRVESHLEIADRYFNSDEPSDYTDSLAIFHYKEALKSAETLAPQEQVRILQNIGILWIEKERFPEAIRILRSSLQLKTSDTDTLFFQINLFLGETYYRTNKLDSAGFFLKDAERIHQKTTYSPDLSRLYNALGVLYFETGNFTQAINYFRLADELIGQDLDHTDPSYIFAHYSFMNNIGSSLAKLNKLDSAASIFKSLIPVNINTDDIYLHLTDLYIEKKSPDSAAYFLSKITDPASKGSIGYLNQKAEISALKGDLSEARKLLTAYLDSRAEPTGSLPDADFRLGKTYQLLGTFAANQGTWKDALSYFHTALQHFNPGFTNPDPFQNPDERGLSFATLTMFETFVSKAHALANLADQPGFENAWDAAMQTYEAAFRRVRYLGSIYDSDQARVFLGESVMPAYRQAIDHLLRRFQQTADKRFLERAFAWVEDSKSISLSLGRLENQFQTTSESLRLLLLRQKETNIDIARTIALLNGAREATAVSELQNQLLTKQVFLSRLYDELNSHPDYLEFKRNDSLIDLQFLQKNILQKDAAIVSFHLTSDTLYTFLLDRSDIKLTATELPKDFFTDLDLYKKSIYQWSLGDKFTVTAHSKRIAKTLFGENFLPSKKRLIVIPHGILSSIPFDALPMDNGKFLLEEYALTIAYSARFLVKNSLTRSDFSDILAMAPFNEVDPAIRQTGLVQLPFSSVEISRLSVLPITSTQATKDRFLAESSKYAIMHLATHGEVNELDPSQTYIAFYPQDEDYRLFLDEIMRYNLSQGKLVFLSSCHSHSGAVTVSEGIIGLSRAFAYAGISNLVTSQWETTDEVSAYLSAAFYKHAKNGSELSEALQLAKLELLADPKMAQYRHPRFWASHVFIGSPAQIRSYTGWWAAGLALSLLLFVGYLVRKKVHLNRRDEPLGDKAKKAT